MNRKHLLGALSAVVLASACSTLTPDETLGGLDSVDSQPAWAFAPDQTVGGLYRARGTEAEAKALLEKAVAEVRKDKAAALAKFTKGKGGFWDRDLYPFCGGPDGKFTAHPTLLGKSAIGVKDKTGKPIGEEVYKNAEEGKVKELHYLWPWPGGGPPVQKVTFYTKVSDQICGVGYYK